MKRWPLASFLRLALLWSGLFVLFGALIFRFYVLQVVQHEHWKKRASAQHYFYVEEPGERGRFFATSHAKRTSPPSPLTLNIPSYHLFIDPKVIPEEQRDVIAEQISKSALDKVGRIDVRAQFDKRSRSRKVASWLSSLDKGSIESWWLPLAKKHKIPKNALFFIRDYERSYPYGSMLGQVLHTVCEEKDSELSRIPTGGLELALNPLLKGTSGRREMMRSPRHRIGLGLLEKEPHNGADIFLTIDPFIQSLAETELIAAVKRTHAKGGWAIMMDPKTGYILAVAQVPTFNPMDFRSYFSDPKKIDHTRCKGIIDLFEPGSVMKPFTLAVGLLANAENRALGKRPVFDPHAKIKCGSMKVPGRSKPLKEYLCRFTYLNMHQALKKSSNVYMAKLIGNVLEDFSDSWYRTQLIERFGFGCKTGIELPSENAGIVPRIGKKHPNGTLEWSKPTPYSMAFGHNMLASSLQLVRAYSVFANGGYLVDPTLIYKVEKEGELLLDHSKRTAAQFPQTLSKEIADEILYACKFTTKFGGSANRADIPGYTEAGKTGTAEKVIDGIYSKDRNMSYFIGMAPATDPRFVLLVLIDEPRKEYFPGFGHNQHAGNCAGPAFQAIGKKSLEYLGVARDDPAGYPNGDPRRVREKADFVRENDELLRLLKEWNP